MRSRQSVRSGTRVGRRGTARRPLKARAGGPRPPASALTAGSLSYASALGLAPWLPPAAILGAAVVVTVFLAFGWDRAGRPITLPFVAALWLPFHLLLLVTGGSASPLLAAAVLWMVVMGRIGRWTAVAATAAIAWLLFVGSGVWLGGLTGRAAVAGLVVWTAGVGAAAVVDRLRRRSAGQVRTLERILIEADEPGRGRAEVEAARRLDDLTEELDRIRRGLAAGRATLWNVDAEADRARPWITSGGPRPRSVPLKGDPLHWAWDEGLPLQLESSPRWASDATIACAVPLDPGGSHASVLTLEFDPDRAVPQPAEMDQAAAQIRRFVEMQRREASFDLARRHYDRVIDLLVTLPQEEDLEAFADRLAESAGNLARGTGAAVATWDGTGGSILSVTGDDGGPAVGATFESEASEFGVAARSGSLILRQNRQPGRSTRPVGVPGERWYAEPRALGVFPLPGANGSVTGLLAVWDADRPELDPDVIEALGAAAPSAGMQLQHLLKYRKLREKEGRDPVTALPNRQVFDHSLDWQGHRFDRDRRPLALLMLDIDHFKAVNDTWGHEAGDHVLRIVADVIRACIREADLPARFGGEEFVVLLPETRISEAEEVAERIRRAIEAAEIPWQGDVIPVRASVGVSACPTCVPHPTEIVGSADAALYSSKENGRNRVTIAPPAPRDS